MKESTWRLIVDIGTGKHKRPKNAPKLTDAERFNSRDDGRTHRAAYLAPVVMRVLRAWHPEQKRNAIKARATEIVVDIMSIDKSTLNDYLRRPKRDRRRLSG